MHYDFTSEGFCKRVEEVIETHFRGTVADLVRKCQEVNDGVTANAIYTMLKRRSFIRMDIAAAIAWAAGVRLDWLAGLEKDAPKIAPELTQEPIGDPRVRETGERYSVEAKGQPQPTVYPGFQIGDQLTIDFVVRGKGGRQVIHAGQKGETNDH